MFATKTLFIVGAGASCEAGLPSGAQLKQSIAEKINIKYEYGTRQISGDMHITDAIRRHVESQNEIDINPYLDVAWQIRDAMPQAISIDNYIDAHKGNEKLELCAKLGIVQSILLSERGSHLFYDAINSERMDFEKLSSSWYSWFMQLLTEGISKSKLDRLFENVSFITFNYDRCIEHFLVNSIKNYYGLSGDAARDIANSLTILHPYGTVGRLPWQKGNHHSVDFGGKINGPQILNASKQIKTFAERIEEGKELEAIRSLVVEARRIVFIGFAYHKQNMDLLTPPKSSEAQQVFATAMGISQSDCRVVQSQILSMTKKKPQNLQIELRNDLSCQQLFSEFWRSLTLA